MFQCVIVLLTGVVLRLSLLGQAAERTQTSAPWGVARVSSDTYSTNYKYRYDEPPVNNVTVYVIDSGITPSHVDFEGRATNGVSYM